jgi:hypothetical protein
MYSVNTRYQGKLDFIAARLNGRSYCDAQVLDGNSCLSESLKRVVDNVCPESFPAGMYCSGESLVM